MSALSAKTQSLVAGALFDFVGHLTTLPKTVKVGGSETVYDAMQELDKWAHKRGLDLSDANVDGWDKTAGEVTLEMLANEGIDDQRRVAGALRAFAKDFPQDMLSRPETALTKWATRHRLSLANPQLRWSAALWGC
jgi:hypothetical protein